MCVGVWRRFERSRCEWTLTSYLNAGPTWLSSGRHILLRHENLLPPWIAAFIPVFVSRHFINISCSRGDEKKKRKWETKRKIWCAQPTRRYVKVWPLLRNRSETVRSSWTHANQIVGAIDANDERVHMNVSTIESISNAKTMVNISRCVSASGSMLLHVLGHIACEHTLPECVRPN